MKCQHLVVDTAAIVKIVPLWEYGDELYSLPEVTDEIRDKQARQYLDSLPVKILMRQPQAQSIKFINEFSKKTGDFASLSLTDVKLLALTYELEIEAKGSSEHLRMEPQQTVTTGGRPKIEGDEGGAPDVEGFYSPKGQCDYIKEDSPVVSSNHPITEDSGTNKISHSVSCLSVSNENSVFANRISHLHIFGLEDYLSENSYVQGHIPTVHDAVLLRVITERFPELIISLQTPFDFSVNKVPSHSHTILPHTRRWVCHISSFSNEERGLFSTVTLPFEKMLKDLEDRGGQTWEKSNDTSEADQLDLISVTLSGESGDIVQDTISDDSGKETNSENYDDGDEENDIDDGNDKLDGGSDNLDDDDDDDDEGWITPSNLKRHKDKHVGLMSDEIPQEDAVVACITADFAMQNVLKHIGLHVMGVDGKLIRHIRTFILRCHACCKTTSIMTKVFCPRCGNKTLKRVSVTVNPDGTQKIWLNTRKPINTRGTKFSLPMPKGGKHSRNPILVEDQREAKMFSTKKSKKKVNPMDPDYIADQSPFAVRDIYSRAAQFGYISGKNHHHYYWEQKNPNVPKKTVNKKKNK